MLVHLGMGEIQTIILRLGEIIYNNYAGKMDSFTGQNDSYTQIQNRLHQLNQPLPHTHLTHAHSPCRTTEHTLCGGQSPGPC